MYAAGLTPAREAGLTLPWRRLRHLALLDLRDAASRDAFFPDLGEPLYLVMAPHVPSYTVLNEAERGLLYAIFEARVDPDRIDLNDARKVAKWKSLGFFSSRTNWPASYPPTSADQIRDVETFNVFVEVTERCNLACIYCYKSPRGRRVLETSLVRRIIDEHPRGDSYVTFSGGEFFLHPDCDSILEYCAGSSLAFCVQTNGTLLNRRRIEALRRIGSAPWGIVISLDSLNPATNRQLRLGSDEPALRAIIGSLCRAGLGEHVVIHAVLTRLNVDQVRPLTEYCLEAGIAAVRFSPISLRGAGRDVASLRIGVDVMDSLYEEHRVYFASEERRIRVDFHGLGHRSLVTLRPDTVGVPFLSCRFFRNRVGVGASGDVFFCSAVIDQQFFKIGHVGEGPLCEIVNGHRRKELSLLGFRQALDTPECRDCIWRNLCNACIAMTYDTCGRRFALLGERAEICAYQEKAFVRDIARIYKAGNVDSPNYCYNCVAACSTRGLV